MSRVSSRVYAVYSKGDPESRSLLKWGVSRFGNRNDHEMEAAVYAHNRLGETSSYVEWIPEPIRFQSAEKMLAHRIRNAKARVLKKDPLFYDSQLAKELSRSKFSVEACRADLDYKQQVEREHIARWWAVHTEDKRVYVGERPVWRSKILAAKSVSDLEAVFVELGMVRSIAKNHAFR